METETFLNFFLESLELEEAEDLTMGTLLSDIEEWDSIGILSLIAAADEEYEVDLDPQDLESAVTVEDIFKLLSSKDN